MRAKRRITAAGATAVLLVAAWMAVPGGSAVAGTPLTASLYCGSGGGFFTCYVDIEGGVPPYTTGWAGAGTDWRTNDTGYADGYCTQGSMPWVGVDVDDSAGGSLWLDQQFDCP